MNPSHAALAPASREVRIPCAEAWLYGDLVLPGATHLFEEHGALKQVAELAANWFNTHLAATRTPGIRHDRHTPSL